MKDYIFHSACSFLSLFTSLHQVKNQVLCFFISFQKVSSAKATFILPFFQIFSASPGNDYCFSFWYYMSDEGASTLTVLIFSNVSRDVISPETALWQHPNGNGDQWIFAEVSISTDYTMEPFQVSLVLSCGSQQKPSLLQLLLLLTRIRQT